MTKGIIGAVVGLVVGWIAGVMLQQTVGWMGANGLVVIVAAMFGALFGVVRIGGIAGAVAGVAAGGILGIIAVRLLFLAVKLILASFGAGLGWRWASALDD